MSETIKRPTQVVKGVLHPSQRNPRMTTKIPQLLLAGLLLVFLLSAPAHAQGKRVVGTLHGIDLGQGEGGGGPLYEDGTANGHFAISVLNGALIFTVATDSWYYADADHIVACGSLTVIKNDIGATLPSYACTTPIPISGFPVDSDLDDDGKVDHKEWVRLLH